MTPLFEPIWLNPDFFERHDDLLSRLSVFTNVKARYQLVVSTTEAT